MSEDKKLNQGNQEDIQDYTQEIEKNNTNDVNNDQENNTEEINEIESAKSKELKKDNKSTKAIVIGAIVGVLCLGAGYTVGKDAGRKLPATHKSYGSKVIATVGDTKITEKELSGRMQPLFYLNGKTEMASDQLKAYEESMIDYMTTTEVLYLEGKSEKITATKEEIDSEYTNLMSSITQQFALSEEDYLKQFKLTKEDVRKDVEKEVIAMKYMKKASEVSEKEAKNYYDKNKDEFLKVRASHILIQNTGSDGKEVSADQKKKNKEKAEEILKKAQSGEDFAELAKNYSQDSSAENGGDLDFFGKGQMVEPFEKAAFSLKVGEVSKDVIESQFGYHIIKKTDEKQEDFDTIKSDLITKLSYEKQNNVVDNLVEKYNVDVKDR